MTSCESVQAYLSVRSFHDASRSSTHRRSRGISQSFHAVWLQNSVGEIFAARHFLSSLRPVSPPAGLARQVCDGENQNKVGFDGEQHAIRKTRNAQTPDRLLIKPEPLRVARNPHHGVVQRPEKSRAQARHVTFLKPNCAEDVALRLRVVDDSFHFDRPLTRRKASRMTSACGRTTTLTDLNAR